MNAQSQPSPILLSVIQLADLLQLSTRTIWRMRSASQLPKPLQLGGSVRWRREDIEKWIADGCLSPQSQENKSKR